MITAVLGGMIIGCAARLLWPLNGRILDVSGIVGDIFTFSAKDKPGYGRSDSCLLERLLVHFKKAEAFD